MKDVYAQRPHTKGTARDVTCFMQAFIQGKETGWHREDTKTLKA